MNNIKNWNGFAFLYTENFINKMSMVLQLSVDGRYIHYRRGQNVYFSSTLNFDIKRENAIIFVATRNSYFIYANAALLFFMKNAQKSELRGFPISSLS